MNVPIIISGGGIIGNYISLRLQRNNIDTIIIEKSDEFLCPQALESELSLLMRIPSSFLKDVGITPSFSKVEL